MKRSHPLPRNTTVLTSAFLLLLATSLLAGDPVRYQAQFSGSSVQIDGTSTIHDWTVTSRIIGGFMEFESTFPTHPAQAITVTPKVEVSIPVRSLKSGKTSMDNVMHTAMKEKKHPKISYRLKKMTLKQSPKSATDPMTFNTTGELSVAGVTRTNGMEIVMLPMPGDKFQVTGTTNLKMTDFGIKPPAPSIGLGLIKTGDDIKITFQWVTAKKKEK